MKKTIGIIIGICVMMICLCACGQEETKPMEAELDLDQIVESIEMKDGFIPQIGIVLGSGLHPLADEIEVVQTIPYEDIPGFPYSTVEGHEGQYILGYLEGVPVILVFITMRGIQWKKSSRRTGSWQSLGRRRSF